MGLRLRPGTRNGVRYFRDPLAPVSPAITGTRLRVTSRAMCAQPIASKAMMSNSEGTGTTRRLADLPRVIMTPRVARTRGIVKKHAVFRTRRVVSGRDDHGNE